MGQVNQIKRGSAWWQSVVAAVISGRTMEHSSGYRLLYLPMHPDAHRGYVYEHRIVAERMQGRFLRDDEEVHHKNRSRADNRPENLQVLPTEVHRREHLKTVTDNELRRLVMLGARPRDLGRLGISRHRIAATRSALRERGLDRLFPPYECPHGHWYSAENTKSGRGYSFVCRQCARDYAARKRAEARAA